MNRPYIICHMVSSIDGRVTGEFLNCPESQEAIDIYYEMNREYKNSGASGFICGRITMEQSFTGGRYPDLSQYEPTFREEDREFWLDKEQMSGFYAIAFDPKGRLGWQSNFIEDSDPGYDRAQIIEVLTEKADKRYLTYLRDMKIPYFIAGKEKIDVRLAIEIIKKNTGAELLILEGGSVINGHFLRADCIDELSLVVAPLVADACDKPIFADISMSRFEQKSFQERNNATVSIYRKKR